MFLSFIVPVYNAQRYLGECLNSLLRQDIAAEDYEIICVNDGSKDGSLAVMEEFARSHSNIVIVNKENGGVTTARNAGLEAARGEYIWFVDADDFIRENCLKYLQNKIRETACDRLAVGAYLFWDTLSEEELSRASQNGLPINTPWYDAVVWRSLIRRSYLNGHNLCFRYPELTHGEDGLFMYEVTLHAPVHVEISDVLYFYREHSGSAETTVTPENRKRKLRSYVRISQILKDYYDSGKTNAETANKLMSFLWFALFEITQLPASDAKAALQDLKQKGLFPFPTLGECTMEQSYMTDRTDFIGKAYDTVYMHLHKRWGYSAMRLLQQLKRRIKK